MSKRCEICGKDRVFGNQVSFSHRKGRRSWSPNVQTVRAVVNGATKKINVCTKCLRSGKVERAI